MSSSKHAVLPTFAAPQTSMRPAWLRPALIVTALLVITQFHFNGSFQLAGPLRSHDYEQIYLATPSNDSIRQFSARYSKDLHVAGTRNDFDTAALTKSLWEEFLGLDVSKKNDKLFDAGSPESKAAFEQAGPGTTVHIDTYYPLLDYPLGNSSVSLLDESGKVVFAAKLKEDVLENDPSTKIGAKGLPVFHGYSKAGQAKGPLVYAHYGTREDFAELKRRGIKVEGSIVIVRYGGSFRGLKVENAENAGAVGALLYSDPAEDGQVSIAHGHQPWPEGPARQPSSVQRGSVQKISLYPGDVLTPSTPAYKDAKRIPRNSSDLNVPGIPSIPLSYQDALPLLASLSGEGDQIAGWQGALPTVDYWTGPSKGFVELNNQMREGITPIWNTYAIIPGQIKDELVIFGNHRDAWGFGASDPISGSAVTNEIVRGVGKLVKKGWKPLRTVVFASWDAEEYGLIGSTEFVEDFPDFLKENAALYFNLDGAASGSIFDLGASPSLSRFLKQVASRVQAPDEDKTLGDYYKDYKVGPLGSGSDFTPFLQHLGVASGAMGFRRSSKDPVYHYHSHFDTEYWIEQYGSPGFRRHVAIAQAFGLAVVQSASSPLLPLNVTDYAVELLSYSKTARKAAEQTTPQKGRFDTLRFDLLDEATEKLLKATQHLEVSVTSCPMSVRAFNHKAKKFEGLFIDPKGLPGRPWYKNVLIAPGRELGYGATPFPALLEAIQLEQDGQKAASELDRLVKRLEGAAKALAE